MNIKDYAKNNILILDGAMGTMLYKSGKLSSGDNPAKLNITNPETVKAVHRAYLQAGSNMILTNTFAAASLPNCEEVIANGVKLAVEAVDGFDTCIGLNIGPIGEMLEPFGELSPENAYEQYKNQVLIGTKNGANAIYIETMSDLNEAEIAVKAAKENCY